MSRNTGEKPIPNSASLAPTLATMLAPSCATASRMLIAAIITLTAVVAPARTSLAEEAPPPIVVTPGKARAFHAAVQIFVDEATPVDAARAPALRKMINEGLGYTGVLLPLEENAFLGELRTLEIPGGRRSDCADWTQSGADALVEGVIRREGQRLSVEYQIWDTARCVRLKKGQLERPDKDMIRLAKLLADDVVQGFTGMAGVAGTEIAFISDRSGEREVYVMDADGGRQRKATSGRSIKAFPNWTSDGKAILYTSYADAGLPGLYLTSRGEARPGPILTRILEGLPKYRGVFDPKSKNLAIVSSLDGAAELFRVDRSGKKLRRLTHKSSIEIAPTWSPDGRRIAFVSDRSGAPHIYLMNDHGGEVERLTYNGSYNTAPAWSPDGRWIAYETRVEGQFDIWLIDPTGEVNIPLITHGRSDESPAWSADGRKLVFSSTRRGTADLYVIDANGENLRRLTKRQGDNLQPSWGPFAR